MNILDKPRRRMRGNDAKVYLQMSTLRFLKNLTRLWIIEKCVDWPTKQARGKIKLMVYSQHMHFGASTSGIQTAKKKVVGKICTF